MAFSHEDLLIARIARISTCQFFLSNWGRHGICHSSQGLAQRRWSHCKLDSSEGALGCAGKGKKRPCEGREERIIEKIEVYIVWKCVECPVLLHLPSVECTVCILGGFTWTCYIICIGPPKTTQWIKHWQMRSCCFNDSKPNRTSTLNLQTSSWATAFQRSEVSRNDDMPL